MTRVGWLIEISLAAWRLAHLVVREDGPWAICARLRYAAGLRSIVRLEDGRPVASRVARTTLAEGLTCVWCVSMWAAALLSLPGAPMRWLRGVLAASGGAIVLHEAVERLQTTPEG